MRRICPVLFALMAAFPLVACDKASEPESTSQTHTAGETNAAETVPALGKRAQPQDAPSSPMLSVQARDSTMGVEGEASTAQAGSAPAEPLRFDMTQDGEAQTAERFEQWMDEQGVRVAEGTQGEAVNAANIDTAAKTGKAGAESESRAGASSPQR